MEWKELVMYILGAEEERQKLLSKATPLKKRKNTLEDRLKELIFSRPWEDRNRNFFSRAWGYTDYIGHTRSEDKTRESLLETKAQLNPVQNELSLLEANLIHEARQYIQNNPGFDQAYDTAKKQIIYLDSLAYRLSSLHGKAEEALKSVTGAKRDYESSQILGMGKDRWLKWAIGSLRDARKEVEAFTDYSKLVEQISAYLPKEAHALEKGIKLARMLDFDHIERLNKQITHLTGFEKTVAKAEKEFKNVYAKYMQIKERQIGYLIKRIRDGAF